jgi:nucleotide-binding universal stress UspA family protein
MAEVIADRPVVVGVDTSEACLAAARWAAREAAHRGVPLRLVHASVFPAPERMHGASGPREHGVLLLEDGHTWLERAVNAVKETASGVRVEAEIRVGLAPEVLLAESQTAAVVVVGSHGLGGLRGALVGSVALEVAARASCPVTVVPGTEPPRGGSVVVGVDASAAGESAMGFAIHAAADRQAPLVVVHAWHDAVLTSAGARVAEVELHELLALEDRMSPWREKYPAVEVRLLAVRDRKPARALLGLQAEAQLIVIGSRGRGAVIGGVLGSTGNSLLGKARCPVVVVRSAHPDVEWP